MDDAAQQVCEARAKLEYFSAHRDASHFTDLIAIARGRVNILDLVHRGEDKALRSALLGIQKRMEASGKMDPARAPPIQQYD
eukprot:10352729-Lingulodinium_polyedra.AAC.1